MRLILLLATLLGACATAPATDLPAECRNDGLAGFAGQPASAEIGGRMLAASGARALRWVAFGQMVTMDFRADRLTVHLDAVNRITSARCG